MLPDKIKRLLVSIGDMQAGSLVREGPYTFTYDQDDPDQPPVSLLMPPNRISYSDGDLFPSMDMNLPEGFLFQRIMELHPKRQLTKMHFLALSGRNGAYFSDRGRPFQADRGRRFRPSWTRKKMRASGESNVSQSSTISLKRLSVWAAARQCFGYPSSISGPCQAAGGAPRCFILGVAQ